MSLLSICPLFLFFFFFNETATTEIYTLSLHDALPICGTADVRRHRYPNGGRDSFLFPSSRRVRRRFDRRHVDFARSAGRSNLLSATGCLPSFSREPLAND